MRGTHHIAAHVTACRRGISMAGELRPQELQYALQPLGEEVMTSLTAQCACRPGLVRVVDTLFTHDPAKEQLHFALDDNMVGERFGDVRRRVRGAVVLGVKHGDNAHVGTQLNPPDETIIGPKDELLLLAKPNKVSFQLTPAISGTCRLQKLLSVVSIAVHRTRTHFGGQQPQQ